MRILLLLLALLGASTTQAASWIVENTYDGSVLASFDHSPGGAFENVLVAGGIFEITATDAPPTAMTPYAPLSSDSHLAAAMTLDNDDIRLEFLFDAILSPLSSSVGVAYIGMAWAENWCSLAGVCTEPDPSHFIATNISGVQNASASIPLPPGIWLMLTALLALGTVHRKRTAV